MLERQVKISNPWIWYSEEDKTQAQQFFEGYAHAVNTRTFGQYAMTKWYAPSAVIRSETGKVFRGPQEMLDWMKDLFLPFEKINHVPEFYLEYPNDDGTVSVHATMLRQYWMKGSRGEEPDTSTPLSFICKIGPTETADGFLGLQWKEMQLYWDKTKVVQLYGKLLPSDE